MDENELNLDMAPTDGLGITQDMIGEIKPVKIVTDGLTDLQGNPFDPERHQTFPDGSPKLGSKNQLLLKKEAKKSAGQWLKDKVSKVWNGEKTDEQEISNDRKIPLSDHELPNENEEMQGKAIEENLREAELHRDLTASSENSADLYFIGGSMLLGVEFLNQRDRFHPDVARAIYDYEKRTGRSIDLPPGVALACGLGRIGWEIIQREPACKNRFDAGAKVVRQNAVRFIGRKLPKFGKSENKEEGE